MLLNNPYDGKQYLVRVLHSNMEGAGSMIELLEDIPTEIRDYKTGDVIYVKNSYLSPVNP